MQKETILLTGGSGMVGRNLIDLARSRDIDIVAPSSAELNLLDATNVVAYLRRVRPSIVIHAAGRVGGIQANMREPVAFLTDNWDMGRNLLLGAREAGIERLINLGSSCMYPRNSPNALREEDVLTGTLEPTNEGYALAKCAIARLGEYIQREAPAYRYKTLIPCNIYGPYDKFDPRHSHLVPAVLHKLHIAKTQGEGTVEIWGDGSARREFMFAGDLADAILAAVDEFDTLPGVMNVGIGEDHAVNDYYTAAADVVGYTGRFEHDLSKPVGMARKLVAVTRAREWGWDAKTSLRDGLQATYDYYLKAGVSDAVFAG